MVAVRREVSPKLAIVAVLVVMVVAVGFVLADRWRRGAFVLGVAVVIAGVLRLVLSDEAAGILQVRSKPFDVGALLAVGGAIVFLAVSIDPLGTD
ncbi:DUF3017 domain-containing protein [Rhodococcus rhodnii]|uniref:Integral membrane protein n=2 Tax=Rhodococcus rhodnii TaxID=38312 RepID=R7WJJ2_9NOCA|nr:DUF3017 domain-containing protein [Rhodococcus rhodnii]EOM75462.1 hypothetical protein Rrhod_3260 [Rhodococcus rhodnii LMG 5362]TXG90514.1 DUF3017 domain-containing protein [Rhodococcus rhodnii]